MKTLGYDAKKRFSFRKLSIGLASVVIGASLAIGSTVLADDSETATTETSLVEAETSETGEETASAFETADAEIAEKAATPTVPEASAVTGDVISVEVSETEPETTTTVNDDGSVTATGTQTKTVVTTEAIDATDLLESPETTTTVVESAYQEEEDDAVTDVYERVTKTTTITTFQKDTVITSETTSGSADIVFIIDRSGSMGSTIKTVKENLTAFVNELVAKGVAGRYGLITFSDELIPRAEEATLYSEFDGSYFTTDTDRLLTEISNIKLASGGDWPETSTPALNYAATNYDWSSDSSNRFVILVTDAAYKEDSKIPTMETVISNMNSRNIRTFVSTSRLAVDSYTDLYKSTGGDYDSSVASYTYGEKLVKDISSWIVKNSVSSRYYKVTTDKYDYYALVTVHDKETTDAVIDDLVTGNPSSPITTNPETPKSQTPNQKEITTPLAKKELPKTGEDSTAYLLAIGMAVSTLGMYGLAKKEKEV